MKVGLFDSGIGGLTVLKQLIKKYPNNEYIYFGDIKNSPYGDKNINELKKIAIHNINFLLKFNVDIIIIACGTISSNCIEYLKDNFNIPIIDIISPTIEYLNNSNYKNIGIIATKATINSHIFKNKLLNKNIYEISTPKLVPIIENNNLKDINNVLNDYLKQYIDKIDILVLGCTHYPLITKHIKKVYNKKILNMADLVKINNGYNKGVTIYFNNINNILISNIKNIIGNNYNIYKIEY